MRVPLLSSMYGRFTRTTSANRKKSGDFLCILVYLHYLCAAI